MRWYGESDTASLSIVQAGERNSTRVLGPDWLPYYGHVNQGEAASSIGLEVLVRLPMTAHKTGQESPSKCGDSGNLGRIPRVPEILGKKPLVSLDIVQRPLLYYLSTSTALSVATGDAVW